MSFPTGKKGESRTFDKEQEISWSRRRAVHAAAERGDEALLEVLISAGAALDVKDDNHDTPLLLACRAGDLEFAKVLLDKGADVSAANKEGDTPLLAAVAAGNAQLARELAAQGAFLEASRKDGAGVLVLAIISKNEACIRFAITQGLKQLEGQDTLEVCALIQCWAQAFLNPAWMGARIRDGAAPSALMAEIGALLSWADVCAHVKDQLEDVLAFLSHRKALVGGCSRCPMPQAEQVVEQLASQEPGTIFAPGESGALDAGRQMAVIKRSNKPRARRRCRQTHEASGAVHAVAVSPDGSRLAYAAEKTVVVRGFQTGLVMLQMQGHTSDITGVAFHPTKNILASSSKDTSIRLWDMDTSRVLSALKGHSKDNMECTCKHDTQYPYSSYERRSWRIYEATSDCSVRGHTDWVMSVCFSPDGTKIASGSRDKTVLIWNAASGEQLCSLTGHEGTVSCLAFKPGDPNILVTGSADKTVKLWDTSTCTCLSTMKGHERPVCAVSLDPQGKTLASCSFDKTVRLWDTATGAPVGTPLAVEGCVLSVVFAPCGTKLAASCNAYPNHHCVKIFNKEGSAGNFLCQSTLEVDGNLVFGEVACITYAPDGSKLVAAYSRSIAIFNAETDEVPCTVSGHSKRVNVVRWNNDGTKLASGSNDNTVRIWNPATGEQPCELKVDGAVICLAFSPTEDLIAACDHLGNIHFLNTTGEKTLSPVTSVDAVSSIDFAPCGTKLACALIGSLCHSVKIFTKEHSTGNFVCQSTVTVDGAVSSIDFAPCGTKIAAAFNIVESRCLQPVQPRYECPLTHQSGSWRKGGVKIFNSETGAVLCTLEGHDCKNECLCSRTGNSAYAVHGPAMERSGTVTEVKFASQHMIASNSADGRTKVWDLRTGQETAEAVPQGLFSKGCSAQEKRVNGYVVAAKGNTLCIFRTTGGSVGSEDAATGSAHSADGEGRGKTEETAPVAFFQCDSEIIALDVCGLKRSSMASSNIVVGCVDGQVLQLWAAVLQTRG